jgi:prolipoprotein diacylglyceryl transferase
LFDLAAIPSPGTNGLSLGPFELKLYGLSIAVGVLAAIGLGSKRWEQRGGDPKDISTIATWAVPAGLIGARLYHVLTDWKSFEGRWIETLYVWKGGLGIPGGLIAGTLAGYVVARRRNLPVPDLMDAVAPAIPLGQAIGRLGNWFNQELFGRPTGLPWGLEIDRQHRPAGYQQYATFHPTFLYEALWNLALIALLLWLDRRRVLKPGSLFWCYVVGYGVGRLWVESLRIDAASRLLGVRVNIWTSLVAIAAGTLVLVLRQRRPEEDDEPTEVPPPSATP